MEAFLRKKINFNLTPCSFTIHPLHIVSAKVCLYKSIICKRKSCFRILNIAYLFIEIFWITDWLTELLHKWLFLIAYIHWTGLLNWIFTCSDLFNWFTTIGSSGSLQFATKRWFFTVHCQRNFLTQKGSYHYQTIKDDNEAQLNGAPWTKAKTMCWLIRV